MASNTGGAPSSNTPPSTTLVAVLAALAGAVGGAAASQAGQDLYSATVGKLVHHRPKPLDEQIRNEISKAAKNGFRPVGDIRKIKFRPSSSASWVVVLRPIDKKAGGSDELRVYELDDKKHFKLRFSFRPRSPEADRAAKGATVASAPPGAYAMRIDKIGDLDGSPGSEALLELSESALRPVWPRLTYLSWDPADQHYTLQALLSPESTGLPTMSRLVTTKRLRQEDYARAVIHRVYLRPTTIQDAAGSNEEIHPYAVETYDAQAEPIVDPRGQSPGGLRLRVGYVVRGHSVGVPELLQIVKWRVDLTTRPLSARYRLPTSVVRVPDEDAGHVLRVLRRN